MTSDEFRNILEKAIAGDNESIDAILLLYMPLVNKHCYINGVLDEDLRQEILFHIAKNLHKFEI